MKTREDVEELKRQWLSDGCWDIWDTEGFEEYKDELRNFAIETNNKYIGKKYAKLIEQSRYFGLEDLPNYNLVEYLLRLEDRIIHLEKRLDTTERFE